MKKAKTNQKFSINNSWWLLMFFLLSFNAVFSNTGRPVFTPSSCPLWNCKWITPAMKAQWGIVRVPENRKAAQSNQIELQVVVLRCKSGKPAPALFILGGGPGGTTVNFIRSWSGHALREKFDIVLFDQRGTGFSKPRFCPFLTDSIISALAKDNTLSEEIELRVNAAVACRDSLMKRSIDISAYNSKESAADVDDVRLALGYEKINVLGISYGTRLAVTYMREFPASILSIMLDSTVPLNGHYFENLPVGLQRSVDKICATCSVDPACNKRYPDLKTQITEVINDLEKNPLVVEWNDGSVKKTFVLNSQDFVLMLQQALYYPDIYPLVPAMIDQFRHRNKELASGFITILASLVKEFDYGVYYCVICNESMPFNSIRQYTNQAAALPVFKQGIGFFTTEFNICDAWKSKPPDSIENTAVSSSIPTLVMAGEYDPITPPDYGKLVCKTLPNSYFVEFPLKSHAVSFTKEASKVMTEFLDDPTHKPATAFLNNHPPLHFITDAYMTGGAFNALMSLSENKKQLYTSLLLFPMIAFSLFLLGLLTYVIIRRWKPRWKKMGGTEKVILTAGGLISLLGLIYYAGMIYSVNDGMQSNGFFILFGLPGYAKILVVLSLFMLLLFAFSLYKSISIFRNRLLTRFWRVMYVVLMLACVTYTGLIIDWGMY